jgi:hypothetical protein
VDRYSGLEVIAAVVIAVSAAYLLAVLLSSFLPAILEGGHNLAHDFSRIFEINIAVSAERRRRQQIRKQLDQELGQTRSWRDPEIDILTAAQNTQVIAALDRKLRKGVRNCHAMHWRLAASIQRDTMNDAATHPLAQTWRIRNVDLATMLAETIDGYPLLEESPELVTLAFAARRLANGCLTCPYFACSVQDAPRPCPALAAISMGKKNEGVRDAEIVE